MNGIHLFFSMKKSLAYSLVLVLLSLPLSVSAAVTFKDAECTTGFSSSSVVATAPTGVVAGDVLVAVVSTDDSSETVTATGWTVVSTDSITNGDEQASALLYKVATGSDSFTFNESTNGAYTGICIGAWSGVDNTTPLDVTPSVNNPNSPTPPSSPITETATGITTVKNGDQLVWLVAQDSTSANGDVSGNGPTPPSGMTSRAHTPNGGFWNAAMADGSQTTAGATGNQSGLYTNSGDSGNFVAYLVALRPASSGGGTSARVIRLAGVRFRGVRLW